MAQLAQWLMLLLLRLLLLPGIAPALTFMAVGVDFLWPAQRKKKQKFISRFVFAAFRFLFVFTDLFAFVAVRWRRGIFPSFTLPLFHYPSALLLHAHWENICGKHAKCSAVACVLMQR